jgi:hypothetical protein
LTAGGGGTILDVRGVVDRLLSWPVLGALVVLVAVGGLAGPSVVRSLGLTKSEADKRFEQVCREHGGTPELASGSGDYVKDSRSCQVRYGAHTYEMYAVTAEGFDEREARSAKQACESQARQARLDAERGGAEAAAPRFIWHADSAICEQRP